MITSSSRRLGVALAFAGMAARLLAAGPTFAPQKDNVVNERKAAAKFLDGLAGNRPASKNAASWRERMKQLSRVKPPRWTKDHFKNMDSYEVAHTIGAMAVIGTIAQAAVGTSQQAIQAVLLQKWAALLAGNSNASLAQTSVVLSNEAAAVAAGDAAGAATALQGLQQVGIPSIPSDYAPTMADLSNDGGLQDSMSYDWGSTGTALGEDVMAAVAALFTTTWVGAIVVLVVALITSAINGSFSQENHSYSMKGSPSGGFIAQVQAPAGTWSSSQDPLMIAQQSIISQASSTMINQGSMGANAGGTNTVLNVKSGAAGQAVNIGNGTAAGGALVGAAQVAPDSTPVK